MGNKSLIANWISKCDQGIDAKCKSNDCKKCQYTDICIKVALLYIKFKKREYLK